MEVQDIRLIAVTQGVGALEGRGAQDIITYTARVSSPNNQASFETSGKLLAYLIKQGHWSPLEQVSMTLEVTTSRAVSAQIIRHKGLNVQEFSQRYSEVAEFQVYPARRQDSKNRQNSIDDMPEEDKQWFINTQQSLNMLSMQMYRTALSKNIAKEQARMLLPISSKTTLYITGNARSWVHYLQVRTHPSTQKEHRDVAEKCKGIFMEQFPDISEALGWENG